MKKPNSRPATVINLQNEDAKVFVSLLEEVLGLAYHEFGNTLPIIRRYSNRLRKIVAAIPRDSEIFCLDENLRAIEEIADAIDARATRALNNTVLLFERHTNSSGVNMPTTNVYQIVSAIGTRHKDMKIATSRNSWRTLEIIFPRNLMTAILIELIENIKKVVGPHQEIFISWAIRGSQFICDVHDNGPGIVADLGRRPMILTGVSPAGAGLNLIQKILRRINGFLLFARSHRLGGTMTRIIIPSRRYYKRGREYAN